MCCVAFGGLAEEVSQDWLRKQLPEKKGVFINISQGLGLG